MSYNLSSLQQQLQDLSRQYQQLTGQQQSIPQPIYQQLPVQPVVQPRQVQYVEGLAGARLYQDGLPSNSSEVIMDKDENIFYMVSKDANGTPSKRIPRARFTIEEQVEEEPVSLTRKDLDDFKEEIRQMIASSTQQKPIVLSSPVTQKVKEVNK